MLFPIASFFPSILWHSFRVSLKCSSFDSPVCLFFHFLFFRSYFPSLLLYIRLIDMRLCSLWNGIPFINVPLPLIVCVCIFIAISKSNWQYARYGINENNIINNKNNDGKVKCSMLKWVLQMPVLIIWSPRYVHFGVCCSSQCVYCCVSINRCFFHSRFEFFYLIKIVPSCECYFLAIWCKNKFSQIV